jgi:hypothetical protein
VGLNDISATLTVPDPIVTNATTTVVVPDPIVTNATSTLLVPDPIVTNATSTLLVPDPIKNEIGTQSELDIKPLEMTLDIKPVVLDLCYTVNIGRIPETRVRNPYRHHIGLTLFGTEVMGMTFEGEQDTVIEDLHRPPMIVEGREVFRHGGDGLHIRVDP